MPTSEIVNEPGKIKKSLLSLIWKKKSQIEECLHVKLKKKKKKKLTKDYKGPGEIF